MRQPHLGERPLDPKPDRHPGGAEVYAASVGEEVHEHWSVGLPRASGAEGAGMGRQKLQRPYESA